MPFLILLAPGATKAAQARAESAADSRCRSGDAHPGSAAGRSRVRPGPARPRRPAGISPTRSCLATIALVGLLAAFRLRADSYADEQGSGKRQADSSYGTPCATELAANLAPARQRHSKCSARRHVESAYAGSSLLVRSRTGGDCPRADAPFRCGAWICVNAFCG